MAQFASATFDAADGLELSAADSNWAKLDTCDDALISGNRVYGGGTAPPRYYHSSVPPSADYEVSCDVYVAGTNTAYSSGVIARAVVGQHTCYWVRYRPGTGVQLFRYNTGTATQLGSTYSVALSALSTTRLRLRCEGAVISVYLESVSAVTPIISVTDGAPLSGPGRAGVLMSANTTTSILLDNWQADTLSADVTPPVITGPSGAPGAATSAASVAENTTAVHTFTADESVTWSLNGGVDASLFTINGSTGALAFLSAPDYELPDDSNSDNDYVVVVRAADGSGNTSDQTVTVTVTDVVDGTAAVTVTEPLKNNTGTLLALQTGIKCAVLQVSDLASVYETSVATTDASGLLSALSDAAIIASQQYHVAIKLSDGSVGITDPITAS